MNQLVLCAVFDSDAVDVVSRVFGVGLCTGFRGRLGAGVVRSFAVDGAVFDLVLNVVRIG
ncbi:hypothetical protein [Cryobacterium luteum]|uniref:Uncharacterized protein n=1 Tax=Cryobacterium luteum TaxID=1424661 RepID=A0A5F0CZ87_9MICO|nr:hypothetical protein [Cryobacterium luteum]TFB82498.1 hypothetical protein E3O10_17400 [Cryobacterium luteum]